MRVRGLSSMLFLFMACVVSHPAWADYPVKIEVTIKNHQFSPAEIHVPSGKRAELHVVNGDDTAEEFDSSALKVEKVIAPGMAGTIYLRPLAPGHYPFMGEFHADTAKGVVIAE
jgi:heme/copper-type cytochrome/quinol oxidase subunit 2